MIFSFNFTYSYVACSSCFCYCVCLRQAFLLLSQNISASRFHEKASCTSSRISACFRHFLARFNARREYRCTFSIDVMANKCFICQIFTLFFSSLIRSMNSAKNLLPSSMIYKRFSPLHCKRSLFTFASTSLNRCNRTAISFQFPSNSDSDRSLMSMFYNQAHRSISS